MVQTEQLKTEVAALAASDCTIREIAQKLDVSASTVNRVLKDSDVKDIVEECKTILASRTYKKSIENIVNVIEDYDKPVTEAQMIDGKLKGDLYQRKEHGFKASLEVGRSIGLLPSHTLAPQITTILNVQNNQYITPVVMKAIKLSLASSELELPKYEKPVMVIDSNESSG